MAKEYESKKEVINNDILEGPILHKLEHKNIIKFIEYFCDKSKGFMVIECEENGDLRKKIKEKKKVDKIFKKILF